MKKKWKPLFWGLFILVVVAALYFYFTSRKNNTAVDAEQEQQTTAENEKAEAEAEDLQDAASREQEGQSAEGGKMNIIESDSWSEVDLFGEMALDYSYTGRGYLARLPWHNIYHQNGNLALCVTGDIYSVDVDADGVPELVVNELWADGARHVVVYKQTEDGGILYGRADDVLDEEYDDTGVESMYSSYLPEEDKIDIFFWKESLQDYQEKKYTIDLSQIEMTAYQAEAGEAGEMGAVLDLSAVVEEIVSGENLAEAAWAWNNTVDFKEDASFLIQMAVDETGRYEVYGIVSKAYGCLGMILNDRTGDEDNENLIYGLWSYTGAPQDQPTLTYDGEQLQFTYVYAVDEDGTALQRTVNIDCGYDTGHMEFAGIVG